jgi:hypothetical protein
MQHAASLDSIGAPKFDDNSIALHTIEQGVYNPIRVIKNNNGEVERTVDDILRDMQVCVCVCYAKM